MIDSDVENDTKHIQQINQSIQSILFAKYDITAIVITVVAGEQGS